MSFFANITSFFGLTNLTSYPFKGDGKEEGKKWEAQTTGQKFVTSLTLPFRAVKRMYVTRPTIMITGSVFAIAGGVLASSMGIGLLGGVGLVIGGLFAGGLIGWGLTKLVGLFSKKSEKPAATTPAAAAAATTTN